MIDIEDLSKRLIAEVRVCKGFDENISHIEMPVRLYSELNEWIRQTKKLLEKQNEVDPIIDVVRNRRCHNCKTILKGRYCHECGKLVRFD